MQKSITTDLAWGCNKISILNLLPCATILWMLFFCRLNRQLLLLWVQCAGTRNNFTGNRINFYDGNELQVLLFTKTSRWAFPSPDRANSLHSENAVKSIDFCQLQSDLWMVGSPHKSYQRRFSPAFWRCHLKENDCCPTAPKMTYFPLFSQTLPKLFLCPKPNQTLTRNGCTYMCNGFGRRIHMMWYWQTMSSCFRHVSSATVALLCVCYRFVHSSQDNTREQLQHGVWLSMNTIIVCTMRSIIHL